MTKATGFVFLLSSILLASALDLHAQRLANIETVRVGDAGNVASTFNGVNSGSVDYEYNIGKYEVTIGQYAAFLNAVAKADPFGLYNESMATDLSIAGISRSGAPGSYSYSVIGPSGATPAGADSPGDRPITYVSWYDAARFCNWLHNGASNAASTETGAYTLHGATSGIIAKNPDARWWIPSASEWHKAAYYKGGGLSSGFWTYPMRTDSAPDNSLSGALAGGNYLGGPAVYCVTQSSDLVPGQNYLTDVGAFPNSGGAYGTFDQGGNVYEWIDAGTSGAKATGGSWKASSYHLFRGHDLFTGFFPVPSPENDQLGFRVASSLAVVEDPPTAQDPPTSQNPAGGTFTGGNGADASPTPAPSWVASLQLVPAKRTFRGGKSGKLTVVVSNDTTQSGPAIVQFSSDNQAILPAPSSLAIEVIGKKNLRQKPKMTRRSFLVTVPESGGGIATLTASIGVHRSLCSVTVKPSIRR